MVLKSKRQNEASNEDMFRSEQSTVSKLKKTINQIPLTPATTNKAFNEYDWDVIDEYDPLWPNEYDKIIKERREKEQEKNRNDRNNRNHDDRKRGRGGGSGSSRYNGIESTPTAKLSGFGGRPNNADDDEYEKTPSKSTLGNARFGGAAIAPPPSLQDSLNVSNNEIKLPTSVIVPYGTNSVAAKIMAKYGFKDGQGLGKQEQGMSIALQVEKTSKRGGRIIHENDFALPNAPDLSPPPAGGKPLAWNIDGKSNYSDVPVNSGAGSDSNTPTQSNEPSITEIMKAPSKVVLLRVFIKRFSFFGASKPHNYIY